MDRNKNIESSDFLFEKIANGELTEFEFDTILNMKRFDQKRISLIVNDTNIKDVYRQSALHFMVENYCNKKITLKEFKILLDSPTWLKRKYLTKPSLYFGPPPSFLNDTSLGINLIIRPEFSTLSNSLVCMKIAVDSLYKGVQFDVEPFFKYLKGENDCIDFDSLFIIKVLFEKNRANNYL